ncbi:cupredoxin domain-containing protein [Natrarchaeobius oligotrophus]|uniref:Blue (type 1) copper domain-containing protein n=1 Tax=Natrarchaeobius chitinivorans TaxID=1679083 RepID=A0A3N6PC25_NATCH|nr:plastocyanin/azurin family copper-binding protein [Natrarchaeobius chitinivorans]RQG96929.1 hypothetical protein EA472_19670 [Natrarchaeobius chitinivorans]
MSLDDPLSRRKTLRLGSAGVAAAFLAGCGDAGPGNGNGNGNGDGEEPPDEEDGADTEEDGAENGEDGDAIEPGEEIMLGGETQAWQGQEPEAIADEENPTLALQEGESYEITWENLDGVGHNIEIRNDDDEVVDDYETEIVDEEGETQTLEIDEVTDEMTTYICEPHQNTMVGDIDVQ